MIVDIERFFGSIIRNIRELDEVARIRVIQELREKYNEGLQAKIDEANDFIKIDIQPEIEKMFSALDIEMRKVIDETVALRAKTTKEIKLKKENEDIIRTNAMIRIVAAVLSVVAGMVSPMGIAAKIAVAAIDTGSFVVNSHLVDPEINEIMMPTTVAKSIKEIKPKKENKGISRNNITAYITGALDVAVEKVSTMGIAGKFAAVAINAGSAVVNSYQSVSPEKNKLEMPAAEQKIQIGLNEEQKSNVRNTLDAFQNELNKLNDALKGTNGEFDTKLHGLMSLVESVKSRNVVNPFVQDNVRSLFDKFSTFSNEQKEKLSSLNGTADIVGQLRKTENALAVIETSITMYRQFLSDDERIDAIGEAINADRSRLIALKLLEGQIYAELLPMISALQDRSVALRISTASKIVS